ncbi:MAG: A/G-specific adenine glycosylase [Verrucomicrobia bacterium]|nr:A/G-specific adenine glycosylase [Verrucomicrobiota bacterium]
MDKRLIQAFRVRLLKWFERNRRELPWRKNRSAYRVWVAELMLQQTRVDQAIPYYGSFISRFPTLRKLAAAPLGSVLKTWEGLGYYGRARRMHQTARFLDAHHGGRFPRSYEGLLALPGVGPYTAAAVGSLAMGLDLAVVDGNVSRVISRVFAIEDDVRAAKGKKLVQHLADRLLPVGRSAEFNEAMMEVGATVCTPRGPKCGECPLKRVCRANEAGLVEDYPLRRPRRKVPHKVVGAGVIRKRNGDLLIARRNEDAMLGGLWEFPGGTKEEGESIRECIRRELREELGINVEVESELTVVKHAYSHFTIELHAYWGRIRKGRPRAIHCSDYAWVKAGELRKYPFSRADLHIIEKLEARKIRQP